MRLPGLVVIACVTACKSSGEVAAPRPGGVAKPAVHTAPAPIRDVDTRVLEMDLGDVTAVLVGPWLVTTINPGGVDLMISPNKHCDDGLWFDYTGGGVAVPDGEALCARAHAHRTVAFSGHVLAK